MSDLKIIEKLRAATGAGIMACKKALKETKGNFEKAVILVKEWGLAKTEQKTSRATGAGYLEAYIHNRRVGVLLELRCESDFVARSEVFKELAHNLVMQIAAMNPTDVENLFSQPYIKDEAVTVDLLIKEAISRVGENIRVERFCRYEI